MLSLAKVLVLGLFAFSEALQVPQSRGLSRRALTRPIKDARIPDAITLGNNEWTRADIKSAINGAHRNPFLNRGVKDGKEVPGDLFKGTGASKFEEIDLVKDSTGRIVLNRNGDRGNPGLFRAIVSTGKDNFIGITTHEQDTNVAAVYDVEAMVLDGAYIKTPTGDPLPESYHAVRYNMKILRGQIAKAIDGGGGTKMRGSKDSEWKKTIEVGQEDPETNGPLDLKPLCKRQIGGVDCIPAPATKPNPDPPHDKPDEEGSGRSDSESQPQKPDEEGSGRSEPESSKEKVNPGTTKPGPEGNQQRPGKGESTVKVSEKPNAEDLYRDKELTKVIEESSTKEFAMLAARYKVIHLAETKFKSLSVFRSDYLKYKPMGGRLPSLKAPPSFGKLALQSAGKSFKGLGAALYVHGVIDAFANNVSAIDRIAAVTAIAPVVGCLASLASDLQKDENKALAVVDNIMCVVGDVLLFNPVTAPIGIAIHAGRFIASLVKSLVSAHEESVEAQRKIKQARDDAWTSYLQQYMFPDLTSKNFGDRLRNALAAETYSFLSEGADTIGILQASQQRSFEMTKDTTELGQLKDFFQNATNNVRHRLDTSIVGAQRQYMFKLVNNVRDQDKNASIQVAADSYNDYFVDNNLKEADESIKKSIREEKPAVPDLFTLAYLIGQGTGQDVQLPKQPAAEIEKILTAPEEPPKKEYKGLVVRPRAGNGNKQESWEMHPLTLNLADYLQKTDDGMSKGDADVISVQQMGALIKFFNGKMPEEDLAQASPKLAAPAAKELQILAAFSMGQKLKFWKQSEDKKMRFFPESDVSNPASIVASVLGLSEQDVEKALGK
ncbi:hypothetical protein QQS21_012776 [Conoideocrella luteorostrata]|uniref:Heat-labile enterotoxin, A chain n=1 Tax=Conoideocrella luteorostrata TaxID=1105319 RepID=A0AAJ0FUI3_9HYPO|nr:hypothetical protein QQS21_012776 [Conoideocrella luteorostrata]